MIIYPEGYFTFQVARAAAMQAGSIWRPLVTDPVTRDRPTSVPTTVRTRTSNEIGP